MLVAEAPATSGGTGPHLGGLFKDWKEQERKKKYGNVFEFRDFFNRQLKFMPYYTDLVKCGPYHTNNKTLIKRRAALLSKNTLG
jgi:hypothetical protein